MLFNLGFPFEKIMWLKKEYDILDKLILKLSLLSPSWAP